VLFFQGKDGIRVGHVTGVQTCALPICSFGYECGHYDVSMKVAEHTLLPRVRGNPPENLVIADGFSCRGQIAQATDRRALHLAEVVAMASRQGKPEARPGVKRAACGWKPVAAAAALTIAAAAMIRRRQTRGTKRV